MSVYKFLAWTSPGLQNTLVEQLALLNIRAQTSRLPIYPSSAVFFETTIEEVHKILYKPTCMTYLNLRINKPVQARNPKEFIKNFEKIQLHPYIPIDANLEIRLSIKRCLMSHNHSENWKDTIKNYIQNSIQSRKLIAEKKQLLLGEETLPQISDTFSTKFPFRINAYLYQNHLTMYVQLHLESMHKFGLKKYVGKASLSENIADALIHYCNIRQGMTLWDPFCGCGTIIITLLIRRMGMAIRKGMFLPLYQMPIYKDHFKDDETTDLDIQLLANDIDPDQMKVFYKNLDELKNLKRIIREQSPQLRSKSYENMSVAQLDYQSMFKEFIKGKVQKDDLIVITNPPWGKTVNLDKFNKMIIFLEQNCSQCYLLIADEQFKLFDKSKWELLAEPLVGGQWTKIIKYDKNKKIERKEIISQEQQQNQIISQSQTSDIIQQDLSYQRDISEYENNKIVLLNKHLQAISKKLNNKDYLTHLRKDTRKGAQKHGRFLRKLHVGSKTKIRQIVLGRAEKLFKSKIRNMNLQILKIKDQIKQEQVELKKQEVKDKVILDKYKLKQEDLNKIQKALDEKAKNKSIKLLKEEKKRGQTIPKW